MERPQTTGISYLKPSIGLDRCGRTILRRLESLSGTTYYQKTAFVTVLEAIQVEDFFDSLAELTYWATFLGGLFASQCVFTKPWSRQEKELWLELLRLQPVLARPQLFLHAGIRWRRFSPMVPKRERQNSLILTCSRLFQQASRNTLLSQWCLCLPLNNWQSIDFRVYERPLPLHCWASIQAMWNCPSQDTGEQSWTSLDDLSNQTVSKPSPGRRRKSHPNRMRQRLRALWCLNPNL